MKITLKKYLLIACAYSFTLYSMYNNSTSYVTVTSTIIVADRTYTPTKTTAYDNAIVPHEFCQPNRATRRLAEHKTQTNMPSSTRSIISEQFAQKIHDDIDAYCIDKEDSVIFTLFNPTYIPSFFTHKQSVWKLEKIEKEDTVMKALESCVLTTTLRYVPMD